MMLLQLEIMNNNIKKNKLKVMKSNILVLVFMMLFGSFAQAKDTKHGVEIPDNYKDEIDVVYKEVNGWQGRMDIYFDSENATAMPLVINIHGGGWNHGEKESQKGFKNFFKRGFAVVNVEYRLVDVAPAPAAIEDVRCALAYMIENHKKYNIDLDRVVIMGGSAGAHLALMVGLTCDSGLFTSECSNSKPFKVAAIVDKYGITDLSLYPKGEWNYSSVRNWLGLYQQDVKFAKSVSPLFQVSKNSPPVFIVHGTADPIVPFNQSVELHKALEKEGIKTQFVKVEGGGHGKFTTEQKRDVNNQIFEFLKELKIYE